MQEVISSLLVASVPAIISGLIAFLTANKKANTEIASLRESNKYEIEKLMRQHEIDIEALKEKYQLEAEKSEQNHKHAIEIMELEHRNALESKEKEQSNAAMYGVIEDALKDPTKLQGLMKLAKDPMFKKN